MKTNNSSQTGLETGTSSIQLPYVSQFLLGPVSANCPGGWTRTEIGEELLLCSHPELSVTQVFANDRSLTLIGCLLDPDRPKATDNDIVTRLLREAIGLDILIATTSRLGGRWVLIATYGNKKYLFHDAFGLRQVFYTDPDLSQDLWVMSQPKIAADILGLNIDNAAQKYIDSYEFRSGLEYKWPGASTPYKEIRHLVPNHYLDLSTGSPNRYWPNQPLTDTELNDAVSLLSVLFKGLIASAANRFDLALAVTAGIDSRIGLAASKEVSNRISYFTVRQYMSPDDHPDVAVAAKLLNRLGLEHSVIKAAMTTTPEFCKIFKQNVFLAHDHYGPDAEAILNFFSRQKAVITGSGAEVGRSYHDLPNDNDGEVTARYLSILDGIGDNRFAIQHFQHWMDSVGDLHNINLLDLFEWEMGSGNWLAMTQLEFDIAWKDIITPYNCREILSIMLSIEERLREGPDNTLFLAIIRNLWPEVLSEPINPHKQPEPPTVGDRIRNSLKKLFYR